MKLKFNGFLVLLLVLVAQLTFAQERVVSGIVSDNTGMPIPGVSVLIKGTKTGTQTDFDGKYSIKASPSQILVFTYIGMKAKEEPATSTTINPKLSGDALELEGVVVVAFGTQKKSEITGAVTKIDAKALENTQASNAIQSLTGKVAGVQIQANSGQPGDAPQVRFRGIGSLSSSNAPLYVVDGIPYNGDINAIATQDIESISFLKDASSNALYGSRGANGVIIVTTKKGKKGQLKVTYETKIGVNSRAVPEYDMITDPGEYYKTVYNRIRNGLIYDGETPAAAGTVASQTLISGAEYSLGYNNYNVADNQVINPATGQLNPNAKLLYHDDWSKALFRDATRTEHFLSLSSSTDNLSSYLSVGYLKDNGYTVNSDFKRATVRANVDYNVNSKIKVGANLNYANSDQNAPISQVGSGTYSNLFSWARNIAPIYTIYQRDAAGNYILNKDGSKSYDFNQSGNRPYGSTLNPYATTLLNTNLNQENKFGARGYISIDFLKNFNFRYNLGYDLMSGYYLNATTGEGGDDGGEIGGRIGTASEDDYTITNQQLLSWKKSFGNHTFDILVGHESSDFTSKMLAGQKSKVMIPGLPVLSNAAKYAYVDGYNDLYKVEGYFSRINYNYKDKYFVNGSFRRDGSSVFAPENRWGNFYGFGAAWSVMKESFFPKSKVITDLRIKGSYGEQGNDNIFYPSSAQIQHRSYFGSSRNYYAYENQYDIVPDAEGNATVLQVFTGNRDIKWEVSKNLNVGFEIELFNRVNLEAEYFERKVSDLIYNKPLAPSTGTNFVSENIGDMVNRGVEINLGVDIIKTEDVDFNIWANGTHYKNEVTSLPSPFTSGNFRFQVGAPAYAYYLREFAGVDKTNGDALWYMDQKDASGQVTKTTTNVYGNATQYLSDKDANPTVYGGFGTVVRYKNFTLQGSFAYQFGGYMYDGVYQGAMYSGGDNIGQNYHKDSEKAWSVDNPNSNIPRIDHISIYQTAASDYFLIKSDYLSLQDVSLSYDFKNSKLTDLGITSTKFSLMGTNLALWSERKGMDPRLNNLGSRSNNGQSLNVYGVMKTISFGLTVNF